MDFLSQSEMVVPGIVLGLGVLLLGYYAYLEMRTEKRMQQCGGDARLATDGSVVEQSSRFPKRRTNVGAANRSQHAAPAADPDLVWMEKAAAGMGVPLWQIQQWVAEGRITVSAPEDRYGLSPEQRDGLLGMCLRNRAARGRW